jgi:hypothetical protein
MLNIFYVAFVSDPPINESYSFTDVVVSHRSFGVSTATLLLREEDR